MDGIPLDFFSDNCLFLHLILPDVKERLFQSLGIDTKNKFATMNWELYVELYCIVELGHLNESKMIRFWLKFLDPIGWGLVEEDSYIDILEKLVWGKSLKEPNEATLKFARFF